MEKVDAKVLDDEALKFRILLSVKNSMSDTEAKITVAQYRPLNEQLLIKYSPCV